MALSVDIVRLGWLCQCTHYSEIILNQLRLKSGKLYKVKWLFLWHDLSITYCMLWGVQGQCDKIGSKVAQILKKKSINFPKKTKIKQTFFHKFGLHLWFCEKLSSQHHFFPRHYTSIVSNMYEIDRPFNWPVSWIQQYPNSTFQRSNLECIAGNLCRCTGYRPTLDGFNTFAKVKHLI